MLVLKTKFNRVWENFDVKYLWNEIRTGWHLAREELESRPKRLSSLYGGNYGTAVVSSFVSPRQTQSAPSGSTSTDEADFEPVGMWTSEWWNLVESQRLLVSRSRTRNLRDFTSTWNKLVLSKALSFQDWESAYHMHDLELDE